MIKVIKWFSESNRWKHLLGGIVLGLISDGWWCAILVGTIAGGCLEYKDKIYENNWDWIDFSLTLLGAALGFTLKYLIVWNT